MSYSCCHGAPCGRAVLGSRTPPERLRPPRSRRSGFEVLEIQGAHLIIGGLADFINLLVERRVLDRKTVENLRGENENRTSFGDPDLKFFHTLNTNDRTAT